MKFKKWKKLLKKNKAKAAEALVRVEYELDRTGPLNYTTEALAEDVLALHTGLKTPYSAMKRKELLDEGKRVFEIEDDEGASSSDSPTAPSGA